MPLSQMRQSHSADSSIARHRVMMFTRFVQRQVIDSPLCVCAGSAGYVIADPEFAAVEVIFEHRSRVNAATSGRARVNVRIGFVNFRGPLPAFNAIARLARIHEILPIVNPTIRTMGRRIVSTLPGFSVLIAQQASRSEMIARE